MLTDEVVRWLGIAMETPAGLDNLLRHPTLRLRFASDLMKTPETPAIMGAGRPAADACQKMETANARRQQDLDAVSACPGLHEWFLRTGQEQPSSGGLWFAALTAMTVAAGKALERLGRAHVFFIGARCVPSPQLLQSAVANYEETCIFINPANDLDRFWAIDQALRCPAAAAVVADAAGCSAVTSRKLRLAAEAGGTVGLLARPPWEAEETSSAAFRWLVAPRPSPTCFPRWHVRLGRRQHTRLTPARGYAGQSWVVEWRHEASRAILAVCGDEALESEDSARGELEPGKTYRGNEP